MSERVAPPKWFAVAVGLTFAGIGLAGIVTSVTQYDRFSVREWTEIRPNVETGWVTFSGFDPGGTALLCMLSLAVGVAIAGGPFLGVAGRQNLALLITVVWHVLGIGTAICYAVRAPQPYWMTPFLVIAAHEWAGLLPLAFAIGKSRATLYDATWNCWAGIVPGALVGAILGGFVDLTTNLQLPTDAPSAGNWVIGAIIGGATTGLLALRLSLKRRPETMTRD